MVSTPRTPEVRYPDPLPPVPTRSDSQTASLAEAQRLKFFKQGGRAATMLTGGQGTSAPSSAVQFLGGAAAT